VDGSSSVLDIATTMVASTVGWLSITHQQPSADVHLKHAPGSRQKTDMGQQAQQAVMG
jgi:hypothetical protein